MKYLKRHEKGKHLIGPFDALQAGWAQMRGDYSDGAWTVPVRSWLKIVMGWNFLWQLCVSPAATGDRSRSGIKDLSRLWRVSRLNLPGR